MERCSQRREEVRRKLSSAPRKVEARPKSLVGVEVRRNHREELEEHLGAPAPYKIATMGSARRLAYMASVVVGGEQHKTYPQTFPSQAEAEDALAATVLARLGLEGGQATEAEVEPGVTEDLLTFADRVLKLLGKHEEQTCPAGGIEVFAQP